MNSLQSAGMKASTVQGARRAARRALGAIAVAIAASGCSTTRPWINQPLEPGPRIDSLGVAQRDPSAIFAISLSGGGARAAAFGYGVLRELRDTPCCWQDRSSNVLEAIDLVSGVSGGSIVASYFAAFGAAALDSFEPDFLRQNFQDSLIGQVLQPSNLYDLGSPWFGRSHLLQRRLDVLYRGMTFGDVERRPRHPQLLVTATDMSLGIGFEFTASQFQLICSDFDSVPLSFAVTASSAVPIALSPLTLRNYRGECRAADDGEAPIAANSPTDYRTRLLQAGESSYRDAQARPFIHLVDGGLADNLGVKRLVDRMIATGLDATFADIRIRPGSVHRLVIFVVNAERDPARNVDLSDRVPGTLEVFDALLFGAGNRATVETQEFLADVARRFREDLRDGRRSADSPFAADAEIFLIPVNLRDAPDLEERRFLLQVPTAFSLGEAEVDRLIAAGRAVLRASGAFQALRRSIGAGSP